MDGANERREAAVEFLQGNNANTDAVDEQPEVEEAEEIEASEDDERGPDEVDEEEVEELEEEEESEEESEGDEPEEGEGDEEESEEDGQDEDESEEVEVPEDIQNKADLVDMIVQALDGTNYPIENPEDLDAAGTEIAARLTDAHHLYAIVDGNGTVEQLFNRIEQFQGKEVADAVLVKVLDYAKQKGLVEGGDDNSLVDPVAEENKRLKAELARKNNPAQQQTENRGAQIFNSAVSEMKRLADEASIDDWTVNNVLIPALGRGVNGDRAIINRIARGNFVDIARIFTEAKNHLVGRRVKANNRKVVGRKNRDARVPKSVAGGDKLPKAAPKTVDHSTREGRIAGAKAYLRG